jgi:eukaryotic-like serine/threonine-protein kinase
MAEVWEASDEVLGRPVAVKVLLPHLASDGSFLERFRREAVAAARLAHPNVVATFDTGVDDGVAFIVMELVHGRTLYEVLAANGPLPPARATGIAVQVADALDYAHRHGVVHRDVKPGNILLGDDDTVKVADFGIAKAAAEPRSPAGGDGDLTQAGAVVGTAKYLSPEQVDGAEVDGRADIYALGVVLYEMLCGQPPFVADSDIAVALKHKTARPLSPRQLRAGIPRSLEAVVMRALAKSPDDRYPHAAEMQTALLSIDLGPDDAVPLVVREPTPPEGVRVPTFGQSERSWLWPVGLIMVMAVALGVIGVLFATTDTGQRLFNPGSEEQARPVPVSIVEALSFDPPPGSGGEHDDRLPLLLDGNPATVWTTETYANRRLGGLKDGVGVVLVLDRPAVVRELLLSTPSRGWNLRVYVADGPKASLAEWGDPVASRNNVNRPEIELDLHGRQGQAVLVWITDLGPDLRVAIGGARVTAASDG